MQHQLGEQVRVEGSCYPLFIFSETLLGSVVSLGFLAPAQNKWKVMLRTSVRECVLTW